MNKFTQYFWSPLITEKIFYSYILVSLLPPIFAAMSTVMFLLGYSLLMILPPLLAVLSSFTFALKEMNRDPLQSKVSLYILASFQMMLVWFIALILVQVLGLVLVQVPVLSTIFYLFQSTGSMFNEGSLVSFVYYVPWFLVVFAIFTFKYKPIQGRENESHLKA